MGPVRSLYEQQGGLERAVMQQPSGGGPVMLRPVQMSDCGKQSHGVRCTHQLQKVSEVIVPLPSDLSERKVFACLFVFRKEIEISS